MSTLHTDLCPPRFSAVREVFVEHLDSGQELGAGFALAIDGEIVIDLTGGFADRHRTRPFGPQTLASIFSTTKAVTALMLARLVGEGRLDYGQTVASIWPQFAAAGKQDITVGQALSHQAGLSGFPDAMEPALWFDWDAITEKLAAMAPLWPPGTASGYHPLTFGFIAGEIFRRIDGRMLGAALAEDVAGPLGLDLWIGLPESEHGRVASIEKPREVANFGPISPAVKAAFLTRWASIAGKGMGDWLSTEFAGAGGQATAPALARLLAAFACDGAVGNVRLLPPGVAAAASAERIVGRDLVLPFDISWGAGVMRNEPNMFYGPNGAAVGHSGWGGSCAFADADRRLSGAYVMNRQSSALIGDVRPRALIDAVYAAL
jgi:CubicO group peptidase (beta-lactamase class C family)